MSPNGEKVSGVIEGFNELDAVARIKENYSIVVKVTEVGDKPSLMNMQIGKPKLDDKAFTMMCSQFAIIINAGIPIARTVQLIAAKTSNKHLKAMLEKVATDVEAGRSLASSFEDHGSDLLPSTIVYILSTNCPTYSSRVKALTGAAFGIMQTKLAITRTVEINLTSFFFIISLLKVFLTNNSNNTLQRDYLN